MSRAISARKLHVRRDGGTWRIERESDEGGARIHGGRSEVDELTSSTIDIKIDQYTDQQLTENGDILFEDRELVAFETDDEVIILADRQSH